MRLNRLEVSGGFLDGLRLDFTDGLNVLIGARGAGKTSVLELCRFALGIVAMTDDAEASATEQACAVLGDGTVAVRCSVQGEELIFSRTVLDDAPSVSATFSYRPPLIVSQNEIEAIGLDPANRREILDRLIDPLEWAQTDATDAEPAGRFSAESVLTAGPSACSCPGAAPQPNFGATARLAPTQGSCRPSAPSGCSYESKRALWPSAYRIVTIGSSQLCRNSAPRPPYAGEVDIW